MCAWIDGYTHLLQLSSSRFGQPTAISSSVTSRTPGLPLRSSDCRATKPPTATMRSPPVLSPGQRRRLRCRRLARRATAAVWSTDGTSRMPRDRSSAVSPLVVPAIAEVAKVAEFAEVGSVGVWSLSAADAVPTAPRENEDGEGDGDGPAPPPAEARRRIAWPSARASSSPFPDTSREVRLRARSKSVATVGSLRAQGVSLSSLTPWPEAWKRERKSLWSTLSRWACRLSLRAWCVRGGESWC